jgi:hypothetical protein
MVFDAVTAPIILPWPLQNSLEIAARLLLHAGDLSSIDFCDPKAKQRWYLLIPCRGMYSRTRCHCSSAA